MLSVDSPEVSSACRALGWSGLRPLQREVIGHVLSGKNALVVLPTSAGKSGLYQIPALVREGLVVVVSPLVALMGDQVGKLTALGIEAHALHSHCTASQRKAAMQSISAGRCKLLYLSPERLMGVNKAFLSGSSIQMFAIDEAHCVSEWGHDFRPAYLKIGRAIARFESIQRIALTATATPRVQEEIASVLDLGKDAALVIREPDRANIRYGVAGSKVDIVRLVQHSGLPCLAYGSTRSGVEQASVHLSRSGFRSAAYHAGMSKRDRSSVQAKFIAGDYDAVVATCAFGMGIDHSGIRSVVHLEMPSSLEAFVQESGRAGRDGSPSTSICRATVDALDTAESFIPSMWPTSDAVLAFWDSLSRLFDAGGRRSEGEGRVQMTDLQIGAETGFSPMEVGSMLRILADSDALRRLPYQDREVSVVLLPGATLLNGTRERKVLDLLTEHADEDGVVTGSILFFSELGLDAEYSKHLNLKNAVRCDWVSRCQVISRLVDFPDIDGAWIDRLRARTFARVAAARGYLEEPGCRRTYLLRYFGAVEPRPSSPDWCCDRCAAAARKGI